MPPKLFEFKFQYHGEWWNMRGLRLGTWASCDVVSGRFGSRPYRAYFSDNPTNRSSP